MYSTHLGSQQLIALALIVPAPRIDPRPNKPPLHLSHPSPSGMPAHKPGGPPLTPLEAAAEKKRETAAASGWPCCRTTVQQFVPHCGRCFSADRSVGLQDSNRKSTPREVGSDCHWRHENKESSSDNEVRTQVPTRKARRFGEKTQRTSHFEVKKDSEAAL